MKESSNAIVFVVDDDPDVRKALKRLITSAGFDVETYASAREFLQRTPLDQPGCLVLDLQMPELSGLDLQDKLKAIGYPLPIIYISGYGTVPTCARAMKGGAVDFLQKPFSDQNLLNALSLAIETSRKAREKQKKLAHIQHRFESLTPREQEVFSIVIKGEPNKRIAFLLGTTEKTIKVHRGRVMEKMQAESLADLVRMGERLALSSV